MYIHLSIYIERKEKRVRDTFKRSLIHTSNKVYWKDILIWHKDEGSKSWNNRVRNKRKGNIEKQQFLEEVMVHEYMDI